MLVFVVLDLISVVILKLLLATKNISEII